MEAQKVGVFFGEDHGLLKNELAVDALIAQLQKEPDLYVGRVEAPFDNGGEAELSRICDKESIGAAVICGMTDHDVAEMPLRGDNGSTVAIPLIQANVLERGAWISGGKEAAQKRAQRQIKIAVARARRARPIPLSVRKANRKVAVVGGNFGAYRTALGLAEAGLEVLLLKTAAPSGCFFPLSPELQQAAMDNAKIEVVEAADLKALGGEVGGFHLSVDVGGNKQGFEVGAVVVAVDARIEDDDEINDGKTRWNLRSFMESVSSDDRRKDAVAVLLDAKGPERRCAAEAAVSGTLAHVNNGGNAYVLFRNMPVYGKNGQKLYDEARAAGVQFLRYDEIKPEFEDKDGRIEVTMVDSILPDRGFMFNIDRLVQPASIKPRLDSPALASLLRQPLDLEGFLQPGNIRHQPVSSARKGVLFAGGIHGECDPFEVRYESDAVVSQVLQLLPEEPLRSPVEVVHVDAGKCAACLTCLRLCPHGAIEMYMEQRSVTILNNACWECGICAAACPGQAIEHGGFSHDQMTDVLGVATEELDGKQPTIVFACQQSAVPSLNSAGRLGLSIPEEANIIEVPCAGRIDETAMMDALKLGAERVLVMGCHPDVCRSLKGNLLAAKRVNRVRQMLGDAGLNEDSVQYHPIANNEPYRLVRIIDSAIRQPEQPADEAATKGE